MYYLKKCKRQGCKRTGSVALEPEDEYCNIHKQDHKEEEKKEEPKTII